ncbi:MAG: LamG-like jellyroll fold domain-containing protein [Candidatus Promineifilaceae bacterium]
MLRRSQTRLSRRANLPIFVFVVAAALLLLVSHFSAAEAQAPTSSAEQTVIEAWQKAQESGRYSFRSQMAQTTYPQPKITNGGAQPDVQNLAMEGQVDMPAEALNMTLWNDLSFNPDTGLAVRVEDGSAYARRGQQGEWEEADGLTDLFAPGGDPMGFLAGVKDVTLGEERVLEMGGVTLSGTQYHLELDGPAFADYMRAQLEKQLQEQGKLPAGLRLSTADVYERMVGGGDLWLNENGLPMYMTLNLEFPAQGDEERVTAVLSSNFFDYDLTQLGLATTPITQSPATWLAVHVPAEKAVPAAAFGLFLISAVILAKRYWFSKHFYRFLAVTVILSMLFSPLLQSQQVSAFFDDQQEKKETLEEKQADAKAMVDSRKAAETPTWEPNEEATSQLHANLPTNFEMSTGPDSDGDGIPDEEELTYWETDPNNIDSDGDGLEDGQEAYTIGTAPSLFDTDGDKISDGLEVGGFHYASQDWYLDPLSYDSNKDNLPDGVECGVWLEDSDEYDPNSACPDTDGDGTPDIFDDDNDGDGVVDDMDLNPIKQSDQVFSFDNPFKFNVENLEVGRPVYVDLQMRPTNPEDISFNGSVLDWPTDDRDGQITRYLDTTWADTANLDLRSSTDNAGNGDIRVIPMLEMTIPGTAGHYGNLPVNSAYSGISRPPGVPVADWLDTSKLEPYGIGVSDGGDPAQLFRDLLVYVPVSVETDSDTGLGVAFKSRIPYFPEQGTSGDPSVVDWGSDHSVRLVWLVQMISDQCTDPEADPATCAREDVMQIVHIYDEEWVLTGLSVSEEHGADLAILYEDPTIDTDLKLDDQLWVASWNLNGSFLRGRDADLDGQRDVRVDNLESLIPSWYDPGSGPLYLEAETFIDQFEHPDELYRVMMTDTVNLLNTVFAGYETSTNPSLLFAKETTSRQVTLDLATNSGNVYTADFDPTEITASTTADLSWKPYEYVNGAWTNADPEAYLESLDYFLSQSVFVETADMSQDELDAVEGQRIWAQMYYAALYQGIGNVVAANGEAVWLTDAGVDEDFYAPSWPPSTFRGAGYISSFFFQAFANAVKATINSQPGSLLSDLTFWQKFKYGFREAVNNVYSNNFRAPQNSFGFRFVIDIMLMIITIVAIIGVYYALLGYVSGNEHQLRTGLIILNVVTLVVQSVHLVVLLGAIIVYAAIITSGAVIAATTMSRLTNFIKGSRAFGWIGFVISILVAWGLFLYQLLGPGFDGNQIAKNLAIATAIAGTAVAIIFLVLDILIGLVFAALGPIGTIILLLLFIIDAILFLIGEKTITERLTEAIANSIYDVDFVLANFNSPDRLSFDLSNMTLVDDRLGITEDNSFYVTIDITNTIEHRKSSNDGEARRTTTAYFVEEGEIDHEVAGNSMRADWTAIPNSRKLTFTTTITSATAFGFGEPGINKPINNLYLTESYALPYQGCWAVFGQETNNCDWEYIKDSNHIDVGSELLFDILPSTISGFMDVDSWAYGQVGGPEEKQSISPPVQIDEDNDSLINNELGGPDPDDTTPDTDSDDVSDLVEISDGTDPTNGDTDGDGLTDEEEKIWLTDPNDFDTDDDGLSDYVEVIVGWLTPTGVGSDVMRVWSNPFVADIDGDHLSDLQEFVYGQNPNVPTDPNILSSIVDIDRLAVNEVNEADSPLFLLQFEEAASADVFADSTGHGHSAVCAADGSHCPASGGTGRYGYSADFTNDGIFMDASDFDFAADFSLGFWIKTNSANRNIAVLQNDNAGLDLPGEFYIEVDGGIPMLHQRLVPQELGSIEGTTAIADGTWHHVMFTWDSVAETGAVFVDGVDDTNGPTGYENIVRDPSANLLSFGTYNFGAGINGNYDDFVMYDRVLTPAEIGDVMNGRFNPNDLIVQPGDLFTYEGTITNTLITQDVDGYLLGESSYLTPSVEMPAVALPFNRDTYLTTFANSITGESSSVTCSAADGCPSLGAAGKYGNAVQFNNDSVNLPAISHGFDTQTVAFWIRPSSRPAAGQFATILDTESNVQGALDITMDNTGHILFDIGGSIVSYSYNCDADASCTDYDRGWQATHRSNNALPLNSWTHVMFTYRYTPMMQGSLQLNRTNIILNGVYDSVATYSGIAFPPTLTIGPGTLGNSVDGNNPINARIDELVFYNGLALTNETNIDRIIEVMNGNYYPGLNEDVGAATSWPAYLLKFEDTSSNQAIGLINTMTGGQAAFCTGGNCPTINGSGQFDQALNFDGSDDRLAMNHVLDPAEQPFTAMAWVRPDTNNGVILQQEDGSGIGRIWLGLLSGNYLYTVLGGTTLASPQSLNTGQWYHVAVTYDGSTVKLFLDGQQVAQGLRTAESSDGEMLIGSNKAFGSFFDGLMDDIVIIPAVTDVDGIQAIMNHSYPAVNIDEPFVDFHIDESINVTTDYYTAISRYDDPYYLTTYAKNLPVSPCSGASCPMVLDHSGDGASVLFDGIDDSLYLDELNFSSSEYSVGFWFRTSPAATNQTMFAATDVDSPYYPGVLVEVDTNGVVRYLHRGPLAGSGGTDLRGTTVVTDGEWHYVAVTRERTEDFFTFNTTLFVDGVMEATLPDDDTFIGELTAVTIGRFPPATQDRYFNGEIDEMFISKSGVDANGVQSLMVRTLPKTDEGTVSGTGSISQYAGSGFHRFDETVEAALQLQTSIPYPIVDDNESDLRLYAPFEEVPGVSHFENLVSSEADLSCSGISCPDAGLRGAIDRAVFFDGVDDVLSGPEFSLGTSTLAAWVKADGGTIFDTRLFNMRSGLYLDFNGFHIVMKKDNGAAGTLTEFYDVPFTLPENEWVHVAAVFDYSTEIGSVYVNGALVGSVSTHVDESYTIQGENPILGSNRFNTNALHGYLDDARIYSKALSQAEILTLINNSTPLLRYEFDEESDALSFEDRSVNGYTGYPTLNTNFDPTLGYTVTIPSPIPGTDGQIGNTALFDGNGTIEVSDASAINNLSNEFAIMAWINPDTVDGVIRIGSHSTENSNNGFKFLIIDGNLVFDTNGIKRYTSTAVIQPNLWQHVAVVFDSSNDANFYVNGQPIDTVTGSAPVLPNSDDPFFIGGVTYSGGGMAQLFKGQIDELAIYGRELSDPEILSIYLREFRWYREQKSSVLIVDNDPPTIELLTDNPYRTPGYTQLVVKTNDPTSYVALLDVGVKAPGDSEFTWQGAVECADSARPGVAWCPVFDTSALGGEGVYELQFRAVDAVSHETTSPVSYLYVDDTPPVAGSSYSSTWVSADPLPSDDNTWAISLTGTISDPLITGSGIAGSGVVTNSVMIGLVSESGKILDGEAQRATVSGSSWSIDYLSGGERPFGTYTITVYAEDKIGNSATTDVGTIQLDSRPAQADVNYWELPGGVISQSLTLSGTVSEQPYWGGVLARYHFEEPAGSTIFYDSYIEQEHGSCADCPQSVAALFGQGLLFDGVDKRVNLPNLFNPISDTFSISLWANVDGSGSNTRTLLQQRDGTGVGRSILFLDAGNKLRTNLGFGTTGGFGTATSLTPDTWHHIVFTFDGTTGKIYLDGVLDGKGPIDGEASDGTLILGSSKGNTNYFQGMMDEVTFYSTVLSDYAVHSLAQSNVYGVGDVNVGFELVDFAALTETISSPLQPNPISWYTATVANPGERLSPWNLTDNVSLENFYTIQLRSDDVVGNESGTGTIWRGLIDRVAPQVTASGQHIGGGSAAQTEYTFTFSDFLLDMDSFDQPCQDGSLVSLTYNDPILPYDGRPYEVTATCRVPGHETSRTFTACDVAGNCTAETVNLDPSPQVSSVAILTPTQASVITGTFLTVPLGGGAYDLDGIQSVGIQINGQPFDTVSLVGETDTAWTAANWQPTISGTYTITAVMTDALNATFTDSIEVYVGITGPMVYGDTSCDSTRNVVDALYIMQYEVGLRTAAYDCPLDPDTLFLPACDVNGDMVCNVVDALFIMQCEVGIPNGLCPTSVPTESQVEGMIGAQAGMAVGEGAAGTAESGPVIRPSARMSNIFIESGLVAAGQTTVLPVWVNIPDNDNLTALTLDISYDPDIVAFDDCTTNETDFTLSLCALQDGDGQPNTVSFTALSVDGVSGELLLGEVAFAGLQQGVSGLSLTVRAFEDGSGSLPRLRDGQLRVGRSDSTLEEEKGIPLSGKVTKTADSTPKSQSSPPGKAPDAVPSTITVGSGGVAPGESVTIPITVVVPVSNNLTAATLRFQYDPTVLTFDSCATNNSDFTLNICNQSDGDGTPPDVVSFSAIAVIGVNGTLNLGTITFTGNNLGTSDIVIVADTFEDGSGEAPVLNNGTVDVESPTAITLSQMSASAVSSGGNGMILFVLALMALLMILFLAGQTFLNQHKSSGNSKNIGNDMR